MFVRQFSMGNLFDTNGTVEILPLWFQRENQQAVDFL